MKKLIMSLCMMVAVSAVPMHAMKILRHGDQQLLTWSSIEAKRSAVAAGTVVAFCYVVVRGGYGELLVNATGITVAGLAGASGLVWLIERAGITNKFFE